jgi:hypothetical protein
LAHDRASVWFGAAVAAIGVVILAAPALLVRRFVFAGEHAPAVAQTLRAAAPGLIAMGVGAWLPRIRWAESRPHAHLAAQGALVMLGFVALTTCLWDWIIDDAAITFAYSKNLAAGHGIVIRPGHLPEEGYSNTLWMLLLAMAGRLGLDIAATAKLAGVAAGALAVGLCHVVCHVGGGAPRPFRFGLHALAMTVCLGAPFVVWSASGLEHGLQALALIAVVAAPTVPRIERPLMAAALSALVLLRPEAPLVVAFVWAALASGPGTRAVAAAGRLPEPPEPEDHSWDARPPRLARLAQWAILRQTAPVVLAPSLTWLTLMGFRLAYFGDPLSNPYYAKARDANWLRLINFVGGGWSYLTGWLGDARTWLVLPLVLVAPFSRAPRFLRLAVAVCLAQLGFLLYAGGDWMGCHRFVAPALPVLAVVVFHSGRHAERAWRRLGSAGGVLVLVWFLGLGTLGQLMVFRDAPTTPTAVVGAIARTFVEVGRRLGIPHPSLAHHDAGATSYETDLDLVDLGGLGDRIVAKHMNDQAFMRRYLFEERRPTFIFGSSHAFTARDTEFFRLPEFRAYVPLRFPSRPFMKSDLCYVRRDAVHPVPGIHLVTEGDSQVWVVD